MPITRLIDLEVDRVDLVNTPATRRKFYKVKGGKSVGNDVQQGDGTVGVPDKARIALMAALNIVREHYTEFDEAVKGAISVIIESTAEYNEHYAALKEIAKQEAGQDAGTETETEGGAGAGADAGAGNLGEGPSPLEGKIDQVLELVGGISASLKAASEAAKATSEAAPEDDGTLEAETLTAEEVRELVSEVLNEVYDKD